MLYQESQVHHTFAPNAIHAMRAGQHYAMDELAEVMRVVGIGFGKDVAAAVGAYAMDSIQQPTLPGSIPNLNQFLQNWLPGIVAIITAARKIDELTGITTAGAWEDEQVIQRVLELTGTPSPYGDKTNIPLSSWNLNYVYRNVVRFEEGMEVGVLEAARTTRSGVNSAEEKRKSAALQLEIARNAIGFYGYNTGTNLTYGFLNDPNLPAYVTVATVGGNTTWASKTFLQIQGDIVTAVSALRTKSQDTIDPETTGLILGLPTNCVDFLSKTNEFGVSVREWMKLAYPRIRVVSAPQLNGANGGANVFYLYAESVSDDASTDDGRVFLQIVPAKFMLLGVKQEAKGYLEDYSNATAGVMCKRPYAIVRYTGI